MNVQKNNLPRTLRTFFDVPLEKTASNAHELYSYLDRPKENEFYQSDAQAQTLQNMTRERQFQHTGTVPPLRPIYPNKFALGSRTYETDALNFMVEPQTIDRLKQAQSPRLHRILYDDSIDAALKIGIGEKERQQIFKWLENDEHKNWAADNLMNPQTRRILHKLDVIRKKQEKLAQQNENTKRKQEWLVPRTHPHGVIGVDTPLLNNENDTVYYRQQIKKRCNRNNIQKQISSQRRNRIINKANINSGLLYHCPSQFEHTLNERQLMQTKKAFKQLSFAETKQRLFAGVIEEHLCIK
eukprot:1089_1